MPSRRVQTPLSEKKLARDHQEAGAPETEIAL